MDGCLEWKLFVDYDKKNLLWKGKFPLETLSQALLRDSCSILYGIPLPPTFLYMATLFLHTNISCHKASFPIAKRELSISNLNQENTNNIVYYCVLSLSVTEIPLELKSIELPFIPSNLLVMKCNRADLYRNHGKRYFEMQKYKKAINSYQKALQWLKSSNKWMYNANEAKLIFPILQTCFVNIATCYWKLKDMHQCISNCTEALAINKDNTKALYRRSQAYLRIKEYANALADLEDTVQLEPTSTLFRRWNIDALYYIKYELTTAILYLSIDNSLKNAMNESKSYRKREKEAYQKLFQ